VEIRFDNKVVLVTGASSGIGRATAVEFARAGANVVVHYNESKREADEVVSLIRSFGGKAKEVRGDVARQEDVREIVRLSLLEFGTIDILINNAGTLLHRKGIEALDLELWNRVLAVNLTSIFLLSREIVPIMKEKRYGRIVNLTSISARSGGTVGAGHYAASKAGVLTLTKNMAKELGPYNIMVNAVSPGIIDTRFHQRFTSQEDYLAACRNVVLKRAGTAEECAWATLFLASDFASYILGETIEVNGGLLMD
jgi:3-oxoacyl-[acyl-carrier protein] reductase